MATQARWVVIVAVWLAGVLSFGQVAAQERRFRAPGADFTERRIALVVGNRAYPQGGLVTPENDAQDMSVVLRKLGFEVVVATNLDPTRFRSTIRRFEDLLAAADGRVIALVFYAGHGVQLNGKNYLLPTDVSYKDQRDVIDFGIDADQLLARIHAQEPEVTIMVFDACRDSPLPPVARSARGSAGLARMDPPAGTFLAFATSPGSTASDNQRERNGLFTKYILQHIQTPGLNTEQVFRRVRTDVYRASRGLQLPEDSNRLVGGDFLFAALPAGVAKQPATSARPSEAIQAAINPALEPKNEPVPKTPQTLASVQPTARPAPERELPGPETALARLVDARAGTLVYSTTSVNGTKDELVARIGDAAGSLLAFNDGAIWTSERSLSEQAGVVFDPPLPMAKKDMAVGTRWSHSGGFREKSGTGQGQVDSQFEVAALEPFLAPFGLTQCFRVSEVRWLAGNRYTITRWIDARSLLPVKETAVTVLVSGGRPGTGRFVGPTLKVLVELRAIRE